MARPKYLILFEMHLLLVYISSKEENKEISWKFIISYFVIKVKECNFFLVHDVEMCDIASYFNIKFFRNNKFIIAAFLKLENIYH